MKYLKLSLLIFFFILAKNVNASDFNPSNLKFGWNVGNIRLSYDAINNTPLFDAEVLHFNWLFDKFSLGFNALEIFDLEDEENFNFSILPVEAAFVPINFRNILFLSIYGKAGLGLIQNYNSNQIYNEFYGAVGAKLFVFPQLKFNYSLYLSVFTEYNTHNEFKIGLAVDLSFVIYGVLMAFKENKEREYDTTFGWTQH